MGLTISREDRSCFSQTSRKVVGKDSSKLSGKESRGSPFIWNCSGKWCYSGSSELQTFAPRCCAFSKIRGSIAATVVFDSTRNFVDRQELSSQIRQIIYSKKASGGCTNIMTPKVSANRQLLTLSFRVGEASSRFRSRQIPQEQK